MAGRTTLESQFVGASQLDYPSLADAGTSFREG